MARADDSVGLFVEQSNVLDTFIKLVNFFVVKIRLRIPSDFW